MVVFLARGTVGVVKTHVIPEACEEDEDQSMAEGATLFSVGWELF